MTDAPDLQARDLARRWRDVVAALRATERRGQFPWRLHVGTPLRCRATYDAESADHLDDALRVEVVSALLLRVRPECAHPMVWLTRPGFPSWHDLDAAWLGPSVRAFAEADLSLVMVVLTKRGWYDPRTGAGRTWQRLRVR